MLLQALVVHLDGDAAVVEFDSFKLYIADKPSMTNICMVQQPSTKIEETDKHGNTTVKLSPMSKRRNFLKKRKRESRCWR